MRGFRHISALAHYFATEVIDRPQLAVDLDLVEARYNTLAAGFRGADIFYAIRPIRR